MLAGMQSEFAKALLDPDRAPPRGVIAPCGDNPARRFAVYRNNVVSGLIDALAARFRVVHALVGPDFFRATARYYVLREPPRSPLLFRYGESFPAFIERFEPAASVPYLADVARLELACGRAYHAADVRPLSPEAFSMVDWRAWSVSVLRLHPSVNLCSSPFPIVGIWRAHQESDAPGLVEWRAEDALVVRPHLQVEVQLLPPGGYHFLAAIAGGASVGEAARRTKHAVPQFDLATCFGLIITSRVATGVVPRQARL